MMSGIKKQFSLNGATSLKRRAATKQMPPGFNLPKHSRTSFCLVFFVVLWFACAAPICRGDDTIVTSKGTYKLLDPSTLVDATAVRSAVRTAELAVIAAAADVKQAEDGVKGTQTKIAGNNDAAAKLTEKADQYTAAVKDLKDRQDKNSQQGDALANKINDLNERIRANNSIEPDKRDPATIAALKTEESELATEKSQFEKTENDYNNEALELNKRKADLVSQAEVLDNTATQLDTDLAAGKLKLGKAYQQLQVCYSYSQKLKELMAKYDVEASPAYANAITDVSGTLERLKELSGQGFDNNSSGKKALEPKDVKPPSTITPNSP
jgi:predicted  nucleic acid-binding Zn-ribbon protein